MIALFFSVVLTRDQIMRPGVNSQPFLLFLTSAAILIAPKPVFARPLDVPAMVEQAPAAGKRVKVIPKEYVGTQLYYSLYLPTGYVPGGRYPVIVEYTGNYFPRSGSTGQVKDANLGYAAAKAIGAIWMVLPYVGGDQSVTTWWGNEDQTLEFALRNIRRVCLRYGGDPSEIFLCGFSRGAIGVNYLGLRNREIADVWLGFFSHDHYDGLREWKGQPWSSPFERYRKEAGERIRRLAGRAVLISHKDGNSDIKKYLSSGGYQSMAEFTHLRPPIRRIIPGIPTSKVISTHTDQWMLYPSEATETVIKWFNDVRMRKPGTFTIRGRITDVQGNPIEGVIVDSGRTHFAISVADGRYEMPGLISGRRTIGIAAENNLPVSVPDRTVQLDGNRLNVDFQIPNRDQ
jgi:hypothetical protein